MTTHWGKTSNETINDRGYGQIVYKGYTIDVDLNATHPHMRFIVRNQHGEMLTGHANEKWAKERIDVQETLTMCPETACEALTALKTAGFTGDGKKAVADVLESGSVPQPPHFPASSACIAYGKAIAEYILNQEVVYLVLQQTKAHADKPCFDKDGYWGWVYKTIEKAQEDIDEAVTVMLDCNPCNPENQDPNNPPSITEQERENWRCRFFSDAQKGNQRTTVKHFLDTESGFFKAESEFEIVPFPAKEGKIC